MLRNAKILLIQVMMLWVFSGVAQPYTLIINSEDTLLERYRKPIVFNTLGEAKKQLETELFYWQKTGFMAASYDSIRYDSSFITARFHLGKKYVVSAIELLPYVSKGSKANVMQVSFNDMLEIIERRIQLLEQQGYPFAQVHLKPQLLETEVLHLTLHTDSGEFITYDTLLVTGNSLQDKLFLMRYLNIRPNTPYNELTISQIEQQLRQFPFLKVLRAPTVYFYQNKAQVILSIDDKPSNNFEGILGVRTNENKLGTYVVTGDVNLSLMNVFNAGLALKMQWRSFGASNSDLAIQGYYPYFLGAPIALSDEFSLFRQDSNFQRLRNNTGFSYLFRGLNALQFYFTWEKSNAALTTQQRSEALESNRLPTVNDYINRNYGIKLSYRNLDNVFNPSKGTTLVIDGSLGTHTKIENSLLKGARNSSGNLYLVYDSLPSKNTSVQAFILHDQYFKLRNRHVINTFLQAATMYHPFLLFNEQYQLGGLKTFRGVNELSIKATSYALLRTEYRYILPQTGYFNLFCNGIWYESNIVNSYQHKTLIGFGGGLGMQVKSGVLTVVYALAGATKLVLQQGKIHVGFTAVF